MKLPSLLNYKQHNYTYLKKHTGARGTGRLSFDSHFECSNLLWAYECLGLPNTYYLFL